MTTALKICPVCSTEYPANERFCPRDGSALRAQGAASTDLVGSIIAERYHVIKKLGEGGMGQVYLAEHVKMGRKSAVKVMNPGMVDNVDAISRFNREAANASRINHPNVAGIYDFGETAEGLIYLAMEFVEGRALTEMIRSHGALAPARASEIARQTAEGLGVAHDMGIVHRDLKPDNIMVAKGRAGADLVKVVDFGIAKAAAADNQKVTKTGMVVGTPEYMSPEQLSGDPLDARSDIYSLGLVTFAMLTGTLPFPSDSMQETMIMRLTDKPKGLADMKPDMHWPDDVQRVMDKVLERDANLRYKTTSEFAHDLVEAIERMPHSALMTTGTHVMSANDVAKAAAETAAHSASTKPVPATVVRPSTKVPAYVDKAPTAPTPVKVTTGGMNKMMLGVGGGVLVAVIAAVLLINNLGKAGTTGTASKPPAAVVPHDSVTIPPTTASPPPGTQAGRPVSQGKKTNSPVAPGSIDAKLYEIQSRFDEAVSDGADTARFRQTLKEVGALIPVTPKDSAYAELIKGKALIKLGEKVRGCAKLQGAYLNSALGGNQQLVAKTEFDVSCPPSE